MSVEQAEFLVAQVPLFAGLPRAQTRHVAELFRPLDYDAGAVIFYENDLGDSFYVVEDGEIEILKALGTEDERLIALRGPGEFFGEMSLLEPNGRRTATVRAHTGTRLLQLTKTDFDRLLVRSPLLAHEMLRTLSQRLREAHETTIADLRDRNRRLAQAYEELRLAHEEIVQKERLERELAVARQIQERILPRRLPHLEGVDFGARLVSAHFVGGDLFDFVPLDDHRIGVVVGDVSGKGVPAAIFMALTRSLVRAEADRQASPCATMEGVNRLLLQMNDAQMFVTALYGIVDLELHQFNYVRCGHEMPLLFAPDGAIVEPGFGPGHPLGMFEAPRMDEQTLSLLPGSTLLLYTDGVTDVRNPAGQQFGPENFEAAARAALSAASAQAICDDVWNVIDDYQDGSEQADDVTVIAIRAI